MAATVEGMFVIIDRASGPMRKMEAQALATDKAIKRLGDDLDGNVGTNQQVRRLENMQRETRNLERDVNNLSGGGGGGRGFRRLGRESDNAGSKLDKLLLRLVKLKVLIAGLKFGGIAAGIGILVQAVGALATGLASMVPQLVHAVGALGSMVGPAGSLFGVLAGAPALLAGIGGAAITVSLGMSDLTKAFQGNQAALKRLNPEAKKFLDMLNHDYRPMLNRLKLTAQGGLFAGLTDGLREMRAAFPYVNALLADFSRRLGDLARQAGSRFSNAGFLRDFFSIGQQGGRIVTGLGQAVMNLVDALRNISVSAQPFTDWMTRVVVQWSKLIDIWSVQGRESGRFDTFFQRVQQRLQVVFAVVRNLYTLTMGFFRAASPIGDSMARSFEQVTKRWSDFVNSLQGQGRIRAWFEQAERDFHLIWDVLVQLTRSLVLLGRAGSSSGDSLWKTFDRNLRTMNAWMASTRGQLALVRAFQTVIPAMRAIAGLFEQLGAAILRMGKSRGLAGMTQNLSRLIPMLENFLNNVVAQLGPPLIDGLVQIGRMLTTLLQAGGPFHTFLVLLDKLLQLVNFLVSKIPGLGLVMAGAFSVLLVNRFVAGIGRATAAMMGLRTVAAETAAANAAALGGSAARGMTGWGLVGGRLGGSNARVNFGLGRSVATSAEEAASLGLLGRAGYATRGIGLGGRFSGLARLGGTLGRFGKIGGGAAIAASLLGIGAGFLPGASTPGSWSNKLASVGSDVATGAGIGALAGSFIPIPGIGTGVGAAIGAGLGGAYGVAKNYLHPFGLGAAPASQGILAGVNRRIAGMGGEDPTHAQLGQQVRYLSALQRRYAGDASATGRQVMNALLPELQARRQVLATQNAQIRAEKQIAAEARTRTNVARARTFGRQIATTYGKNVAAMGQPGAFDELVSQYTKLSKNLTTQGRVALAKPLADWANTLRTQGRLPKGEVDKLNTAIQDSFANTEKRVKVVNGRILDNSTSQWKSIKTALITQAQAAAAGLQNSFAQIEQLARGKLSAMGYSGPQINQILSQAASGNVPSVGTAAQTAQAAVGAAGLRAAGVPSYTPGQGFSTPGASALFGHATGGRVGGRSMADSVPIVAGAGELVVNRHTENRVNRMLASQGTTLGREAGMETRRHQFPLQAPSVGVGGVPGLLAQSGAQGFATGLGSAIAGMIGSPSGGGRGGVGAGAGKVPAGTARSWLVKALQITGLFSPGNLSALYGRMMQESGGNPHAINLWDSNAKAGHPSKGLLQTIDSTFSAYALPGMGDIYNPVDNAVAALRYMMARYGHVVGPSSSGYATGGRVRGFARGGRVPMFTSEGPQFYAAAYKHNRPFATKGPYRTRLSAPQERSFDSWVRRDHVPFDYSASIADYDMRGYWKATGGKGWHQGMHFPDTWKTPYDTTFSNQSRYATPNNPFVWRGNDLVDRRNGRLIFAPSRATGGRVPFGGWFGNGGTRTFTRPTVIGVGDSGAETVTVTPTGGGRRVVFNPQITISRIDYRGKGDIEEVVHRETAAAFAKFADDLVRAGMEVEG